MSADRDALNTNLLNSDNTTVQTVQNMTLQMVLSNKAEDIVKHSLIKVATKSINTAIKTIGGDAALDTVNIAINNSLKKVLISGKTLTKLSKTIGKKAAGNAVKGLMKLVTTVPELMAKAVAKVALIKSGKVIAEDVLKVGAKSAGKELSEAAIEDSTVGATICAASGAETGGIGCLVGVAVTVIMMAFDVVNLVLTLLDPGNQTALMHRDTIDGVAQATSTSLYNSQPADSPRYYDEEVLFDPLSFLFMMSADGTITANEKVAAQYNQYQDEYMATIGITGDWRSRIPPPTDLSLITDPGVISPITQASVALNEELIKLSPPPPPPPKTPIKVKLIIAAVILFILFIIGILYGIIFFSGENSNGSTNSNATANRMVGNFSSF